jgi:hypothetical protein
LHIAESEEAIDEMVREPNQDDCLYYAMDQNITGKPSIHVFDALTNALFWVTALNGGRGQRNL